MLTLSYLPITKFGDTNTIEQCGRYPFIMSIEREKVWSVVGDGFVKGASYDTRGVLYIMIYYGCNLQFIRKVFILMTK